MTKKDVLDQIRKARMGHKKWMSYAKALNMGIKVGNEAIPMIETNCDFGKWYYGDAQTFADLESFEVIEEPHALLHQTYMQLYKALREPLKTGLLISKSKSEKNKQQKIDALYNQMVHVSEMLMDNLKEFENEIKGMTDFEFNKLTN